MAPHQVPSLFVPTDHSSEEYLRSLQATIDRLIERDEQRLVRIGRLERDREILRERVSRTNRSWLTRMPRTIRQIEEAPLSAPEPLQLPGMPPIQESTVFPGPPARTTKVATVLDVFSSTVLSPEFHAIPLKAATWEETLTNEPPALLLVESAYSGVDGSWAHRIARFGGPSPLLEDLVSWCRRRSIPTVFWNKEDPINFDWFVASAGLFDLVFTVDQDASTLYHQYFPDLDIRLLPFFAQQRLHRPPDSTPRVGSVAFAGSYYAKKHASRREQMAVVLDPAREYGLHIFDRYGKNSDERYRWPDQYQNHIQGSLSYLQTVEAYRRYKVFLNVNTVVDSPTMCARRVFELAASKTPILTGRSQAITMLMPHDSIFQTSSVEETMSGLSLLLSDSEEARRMAARAYEWVMDSHTASDRVDTIFDAVNV